MATLEHLIKNRTATLSFVLAAALLVLLMLSASGFSQDKVEGEEGEEGDKQDTPESILKEIGGASGCTFTSDCGVGQQCLKDSRSLYGVCIGGRSGGTRSTSDSSLLGPPTKLGRSCYFSSECGLGFKCLKQSDTDTKGACIRR